MTPAELAVFPCRHCGRTFTDGRSLGGHVRQAHPTKPAAAPQPVAAATAGEGEVAARVLELWRTGTEPLAIISALKVHPRFVKDVLKEYDELLNEWKKFKEA